MEGTVGSVRVLLVDDPDVADVVASHLEGESNRLDVRTAATPKDGLDELADQPVDCVVSEYGIPGMDGLEFFERVRERDGDLPFILFTGVGSEEVASEALSAGVTDYLRKSTTDDRYRRLAKRIRDAVERQRAETTYREIFEGVPDGIVVHDPTDGEFIDMNATYAEMFGYEREELLDAGFEAIFPDEPPYTVDRARRRIRDVIDRGPQMFEWPGVTKRGDRFWAEVHLAPTRLHGEDGVLAVVRDITGRKERERRLERYETIVENTDDLFFELDDSLEVLFVNDRIEEVLEVSRDALLGTSAVEQIERLNEDAAERFAENASAVLEGERSEVEFELPVELPSSGEATLAVRLTRLEREEDASLIGVARDVTERKDRERRIQVQRDKIRALHDVATEIIACETAEAVYDAIVDAAEEILEYDIAIADEAREGVLVPMAVSSELSAEQYYEETPVDADDNLAARAYRTGEPSIVDDLHAHEVAPADTEFRSALTVPIGSHGVFQSVSKTPGEFDADDLELVEILVAHAQERLGHLENERRLRERTEELERQNERLDEFVSVASHDLRNPLNVAAGRLELAREECDSEYLDDVADAHDRMATLLDDLLTLARKGDQVREVEPVALADAVERCWRNVETATATLVTETDRAIEADESQLKQLLENLIRNAVEHAGEDVTVTVGDLPEGFYVEDDGPGIPPGERERVLESGVSTSEEGTGFGLSIVREIAAAHGWDLAVTDGTDGGVRFEFTGVEPA